MGVGFAGTADQAPGPLRHFRDEHGGEWAGPHLAHEPCPVTGGCENTDYRPLVLLDPNAWPPRFGGPDVTEPGGPGQDRNFCHTVEKDTDDWAWFVQNRIFVMEIV